MLSHLADLYMTCTHALVHSRSNALMQMADPAGPFAAMASRMHSYKTSKAALNMGKRFPAFNLHALLLYWITAVCVHVSITEWEIMCSESSLKLMSTQLVMLPILGQTMLFSLAGYAVLGMACKAAVALKRMDAPGLTYGAVTVTLSWASDVTPAEGFTFVAMHPGLVMTDMASKAMG